MPIHDWTKMLDGEFHHFHQRWIQAIADSLNSGGLPDEFMAMSDDHVTGGLPDVVTLRSGRKPKSGSGGVALQGHPPKAQVIAKLERSIYPQRADRVTIRHGRGEAVAIIEIVSPGNKSSSKHAFQQFIEKTANFMRQGVHMLVVDLFPPTRRDPHGLQRAICEEFNDQEFELPLGSDRTVGAYFSGFEPTAYIECLAVGDSLPSLPIFLTEESYIPAPLEATYLQAWEVFPAFLKDVMGGRVDEAHP